MSEYSVANLTKIGAVSTLAATLTACAATEAARTRPTVKQAVETAPADLQLACASRAATDFPDAGNILPLSSELIGADVFVVRLTSQKDSYVCNVNRAGIVVSLLPATNPAAVDDIPVEPEKKTKDDF